jgi:hypothetical protein
MIKIYEEKDDGSQFISSIHHIIPIHSQSQPNITKSPIYILYVNPLLFCYLNMFTIGFLLFSEIVKISTRLSKSTLMNIVWTVAQQKPLINLNQWIWLFIPLGAPYKVFLEWTRLQRKFLIGIMLIQCLLIFRCAQIVYALAHATQQKGRFSLIARLAGSGVGFHKLAKLNINI